MTVAELLERMKQDDMNERRYLLMRLGMIEDRWGLPRSVLPREERRHPTMTLTENIRPAEQATANP